MDTWVNGSQKERSVLYYNEVFFFFFQAEDGIRDLTVTGVQTCALPISRCSAASLPFPQDEQRDVHEAAEQRAGEDRQQHALPADERPHHRHHLDVAKIGRASCRERV